jgi:hypothetical protein
MSAVLELRLTGGASNSDPNASLGGVASSNQLSGTAMNNLFDNVSPTEAVNGDVEYRAVSIYNSGDAAATGVEAYMSTETPSPKTQLDFGIEAGTQTIADESTAPSGVTFAHYATGSRLSIADIPAGSAVRLWIRRTVTAGCVNLSSDFCEISIDYA